MTTIWEAIKEYISAQNRIVSNKEVINELNIMFPGKWKEISINTHLYACSVNK